MAKPTFDTTSVIAPIRALFESDQPGVLAVITGVTGPSYRPFGAMMAVLEDGARIGSLSSGCIEADIAAHAAEALRDGVSKRLVYGLGSPFADIKLPCGGGMEITLIPAPDHALLGKLCRRHTARETTVLTFDLVTGAMATEDSGVTGRKGDKVTICIEPELFFYVFGKGPEAVTFSALVQSAGFPNLLLSPDDETLAAGQAAGCDTRHLTSAVFPKDLSPDRHSAVLLFFHDHEWEPPILSKALPSAAFYCGAQGSLKAAKARVLELQALGVAPEKIERLHGPIGLIPSARDARKLAVSVLAEVLSLT